MVPKEYIKELVMLQDNVPGFPFESAKRIIEEDLGKPLEDLYDSFSDVPLAAASLGQVRWCLMVLPPCLVLRALLLFLLLSFLPCLYCVVSASKSSC